MPWPATKLFSVSDRKAKLVQLQEITWQTIFDDQERKTVVEQKMNTKLNVLNSN
jgi:hypothetical protein